jgi:tetratricopeptide (TPR) repeat protein
MKRITVFTVSIFILLGTIVLCADAQIDRGQAFYHYLIASHKELTRDYSAAIEEYREALKYDPESSEILSHLAALYIQTNRIDDAVAESKLAIGKNPDNKEAHRMLAQIYMEKMYAGEVSAEDLKGALQEFGEVHRLDPNDEEALLALGQLSLQNDDYASTVKYLEPYIANNPDSSTAALSLASAYSHLGEFDEAITTLKKYLQSKPDDSNVWQQLASLYEKKGDYSSALQYQKQVYEADPDAIGPTRRYVDLLQKSGDYKEAIAVLEKKVQDSADKTPWSILLARALAKSGNLERAESIMKENISANSDDFDMKLSLVQIYEDVDHNQEALALLGNMKTQLAAATDQSEKEKRSDEVLLYTHTGFNLARLKRYDESNAAYQSAREIIQPEDQAKIDYYIAANYRAQKNYDKSITTLESVVHADPKDFQAWELLSIVYEEKGDLQKADEIIARLITDNPDDPDYAIFKAERLQQREKYQASIDYLTGIVGKFQSNDDIYFLLGAGSERMKKIDQAETYFRKAIDLNPRNSNALNYLGYMLIDQGVRLDESVGYVKRALELDHDNGAFLDSLGWGYYKLNRLDLAEDNLRQALQKMGDNGVVHDHLGDLYFKLGKFKEAIQQWQAALATKDKDIDAQLIQKKIDDTKNRIR